MVAWLAERTTVNAQWGEGREGSGAEDLRMQMIYSRYLV